MTVKKYTYVLNSNVFICQADKIHKKDQYSFKKIDISLKKINICLKTALYNCIKMKFKLITSVNL